MSVTSVAFVPCAPLLVPDVAGGSAWFDDDLRGASLAAVAAAVGAAPRGVTVVATTHQVGEWSRQASWDFAGFGVARADPTARPRLPWQLGIGAWLLDECGYDGPRRYIGVTAAEAPVRAEPEGDGPTALVVVGDGSACRTEKAPGYLDPRAEPFDDAIATLLATGDAAGLADLDVDLAGELLCRSLPAWRWVAAMLSESPVVRAELAMHVAPYGVGYFVASWTTE